jgi:hypothetical protein
LYEKGAGSAEKVGGERYNMWKMNQFGKKIRTSVVPFDTQRPSVTTIG